MPNTQGSNFAAGFAKGFANILNQRHQEEVRKKDQWRQAQLFGLQEAIKNGQLDLANLPDALGVLYGDEPGKGPPKVKAGQPDDRMVVSKVLEHALSQNQGVDMSARDAMASASTGPGAFGTPQQAPPPADPHSLNKFLVGANAPTDMANRARPGDPSMGAQTLPADPRTGGDFMGVPLRTQEEVVARQAAAQRDLLARQMKIALDFVATGVFPDIRSAKIALKIPVDDLQSTTTPAGFTLSPGQQRFDAAGNPIASAPEKPVTPPAPVPFTLGAGQNRYDAQGKVIAEGPAAATAAAGFTLGPGQKRFDAGGNPVASVAPTAAAAGGDLSALARLAARSPQVLQGTTPTVISNVMGEIAKDPALLAQYESSRMAPIRARAETVLQTMNDLLRVDPKTGEVTGLTPGGAGLYGLGPGRIARFIPGSDTANAKAALDQLTGQKVLDMITEMKAQTKTGATGFGQLSEKELAVLESAATVLKGEISPDRALQELKHLREQFVKILAKSASEQVPKTPQGGATTGGIPGITNGPNGELLVNGQPFQAR